MKLSPFFEVNGNRYEIRRSRFLMCEWEKLRESTELEENAQQKVLKLQEEAERLEKLKDRVDELYDAYLTTFSEEAKSIYEQAQSVYDKMSAELAPVLNKDSLIMQINKSWIDNVEKLVIIALQHNEKGDIIRSKEEAEEIWCAWVDEVGQLVEYKWLNAFIDHILGRDEIENGGDNSFLAQAKARAEQQAENRKAGLAKIKR